MATPGDSRAVWLFAAFAVAAVLLVLDALLLASDLRQQFRFQQELLQTYERLDLIDDVEASVYRAETGQRGYLLTGDERYLRPYDAAQRDLPALRAALARSYVGSSRADLDALDSLTTRKLFEMGTSVAAYNQGHPDEAIAVVLADSGRVLMETIVATLESLRTDEASRLETTRLLVADGNSRVIATFTITTIIALGMIGFLYLLTTRDFKQRERIERTLRHHRDELEARVQLRTREFVDANARLVETVDELGRSNRELEEFAYVASHDLQEPLRKIRMFSGLLREETGALGPDAQHYLERLHDSAERMSALINDLLTYSRVRTRQEPFAPVDLNALVASVVGAMDEPLRAAGARVDVGPLPTLVGDAAQLRQVAMHLVSNAVKFRHPDRPLVLAITAERVEGEDSAGWRLCFQDNGIGFEPRFADRIFKPFQKLHPKTQYPGTGVGLAIVRRVAERHRATITAEGVPGEGAVFCLDLPDAAVVPGGLAHAPEAQHP